MSIEIEQLVKPKLEKENAFFYRAATAADIDVAKIVSHWTLEAGTMLPKTVEDILDMFKKGHSVLVFNEQGEIVSHAAITFIYSDGAIEIGAVVTDKNKRKKGAGTAAVKAILEHTGQIYPGIMKFALANEASAPIFEKLGARKMSSDELSDEVWGPCATCPKRPLQTSGKPFTCCDIPYDLTYISL